MTDLLTVSATQVLAFLGNGNVLKVPEEGRDERYFFQQWSVAYAKYMTSPHVLDSGLRSAGAIVDGAPVNGNPVGDFSAQFVDTDDFIYGSSGGGGARSEFVDFDAADVNNDPVSLEQRMRHGGHPVNGRTEIERRLAAPGVAAYAPGMAERLVVVEEAFVARGPGVLVAPRITLTRPAAPLAVRLRLPDGTERAATASFDVAHIRGPLAPFAMVRLVDCTVSDVPPGTEVWTVD